MDGPAILAQLQERFGAAILETHDHRGDHTAVVEDPRPDEPDHDGRGDHGRVVRRAEERDPGELLLHEHRDEQRQDGEQRQADRHVDDAVEQRLPHLRCPALRSVAALVAAGRVRVPDDGDAVAGEIGVPHLVML